VAANLALTQKRNIQASSGIILPSAFFEPPEQENGEHEANFCHINIFVQQISGKPCM